MFSSLRKCLAAPACSLAAAIWLTGCASPGVPKPPSLHLPEKVTNLTAERIGGDVRLAWTTPSNTTDGDAIRGATTAVLCRVSGRSTSCAPVKQVAVAPGPATAEDVLPATLQVGADSVAMYRVELKNDLGRSAGPSEPAFAAAGRAPEMPLGVSAQPRPGGVLITWQAETGGAPGVVMELHRTGPGTTVAKAEVPVKTKAATSPFAAKEKTPEGAVVLVADVKSPWDGMVDHSALDGETYTYVAQRVRTVHLAGRTLELRSAASTPVTVTYRDTFAPQPPAGLASVPGGGFGAAPSVDLSWEPNAEPDLTGYRVYRSVDGAKAILLTAKPVPGPAYRDLDVIPGHRYGYRVTAVDAHGNESGLSAEAVEILH